MDTAAAARECLENVLEVQPQALGGIRRLYVDGAGDIRAYELDDVVYVLDDSIPSSAYRSAVRMGDASPIQSTIPLAPPPPPAMSRMVPPPPPMPEMFDEPRANTGRQLLRTDALQTGRARLRPAEPEVMRAPPEAREGLMAALRDGIQLKPTPTTQPRKSANAMTDLLSGAINKRRGALGESEDEDEDEEWE